MIGKQLGDWVIDESLARGVNSELWRAHHHDRPDDFKAIKLICRIPKDVRFQTNWQASAAVWRRIRHPNLVGIHDHGLHEDRPFLIRDHVIGQDYQSLLQEGKKPSWQEVLQIARQVIACLRHLHRRGMLHGELKPAHLIAMPNGNIRLIDAGILQLFPELITEQPDVCETTFCYLAPEVLQGKKASKRSDFYSLGVLLYSLIVGRPPFHGSMAEIVRKHSYILPERPSHFVPGLPAEIDQIIMRLLVKDPASRPNSGTLLQAEFERIWGELEQRKLLSARPELVDLDPPSPDVASLIEDRDSPGESLLEDEAPDGSRFWLRVTGFAFGLMFVIAILLRTFWPDARDPMEMLAKAKPYMESTNPQDWLIAWEEYFEPLEVTNPDALVDDRDKLRRKIDAWQAQNRAFAAAQLIRYDGEAAHWYRLALDALEAGDYDEAEDLWLDLVAIFEEIPEASDWVLLAKQGIDRLNRLDIPRAAARKLQGERFLLWLPQLEKRVGELLMQQRYNEIKSLLRLLQARYSKQPVITEWIFRQKARLPKDKSETKN